MGTKIGTTNGKFFPSAKTEEALRLMVANGFIASGLNKNRVHGSHERVYASTIRALARFGWATISTHPDGCLMARPTTEGILRAQPEPRASEGR